MIAWLIRRGPMLFFRGLRRGDIPAFAFGGVLLLLRWSRRNRETRVTKITLRAGQSAALRVTRPGAAPVAYRIDA